MFRLLQVDTQRVPAAILCMRQAGCYRCVMGEWFRVRNDGIGVYA